MLPVISNKTSQVLRVPANSHQTLAVIYFTLGKKHSTGREVESLDNGLGLIPQVGALGRAGPGKRSLPSRL